MKFDIGLYDNKEFKWVDKKEVDIKGEVVSPIECGSLSEGICIKTPENMYYLYKEEKVSKRYSVFLLVKVD
ncbi:hypothetical protein SBV1_gp03 [Sulfolobales Beppu virus 1]|nr:hypothetical protein SBV1_gp03 [Sulfolobales Beppu virus 1]